MRTKTLLISMLVASTCAMGACKKDEKKNDPAKTTEGSGSAKATAAATGTGAATAAATGAATGTAAATGAATGAAAATGATGGTSSAGMTVLDAGADPKVELRYAFTAGTKQAIDTAMDMKMSVPQMGEMTMPTMVMPADVEVLSVDGGKATYKTVFKGLEVRDVPGTMPGIADAMKQMGAGMAGMTITATVDPQGHASDFKVEGGNLPPEMKQQMDQAKQSMEQAIAQLPTEAVGKGAKWQVKQTVDQGGMKIDQTIVFELVEVSGTSAKIKAVYAMSAGKQTVDMQGVQATLESLNGSGDMEMTVDLTKPVAAVTGTIDTKTKMSAMGQMMDLGMGVKLTITVK